MQKALPKQGLLFYRFEFLLESLVGHSVSYLIEIVYALFDCQHQVTSIDCGAFCCSNYIDGAVDR
jgi:hypothetical protein